MAELQLTKAGPLAAAPTTATARGGAPADTDEAGGFSELLGPQEGAPQRAAEGGAGLMDRAEQLELVPLDDGRQVMDAVPGWPPAVARVDAATGAVVMPPAEAGVPAEEVAAAAPMVDDIAVAAESLAPATAVAVPPQSAAARPGSPAGPAAGVPGAPGSAADPGAALPVPSPAAVVAAAPEGFKPVPLAHTVVTAVHPVMQDLDGAAGADARKLPGDSLAPLLDSAGRPGAGVASVGAGLGGATAVPGGAVVNTQSPQWVNQTAEVLVHQAGAGATRARLVMHPAELGTVQVDLHLGADRRVDIVMTADTPAARDLMEQNAHQLRERLSEQGMTAGQLDVGVRQQPSDAGPERDQSAGGGEGADASAADSPENEDAQDGSGGRTGLLDAYA